MTWQPHSDLGRLTVKAPRSHSDTPQSVGILWTSDQPDAHTSTWQHTTLTTDIPAPIGIRTRKPSRLAAADRRLRPRGHCSEQMIKSNLTMCETCSFLNTSNSATGCGSFSNLLHKTVIIATLISSNTNNKRKLRTEMKIITVRVVTAVQVGRFLNLGSIPSDEQNSFPISVSKEVPFCTTQL